MSLVLQSEVWLTVKQGVTCSGVKAKAESSAYSLIFLQNSSAFLPRDLDDSIPNTTSSAFSIVVRSMRLL